MKTLAKKKSTQQMNKLLQQCDYKTEQMTIKDILNIQTDEQQEQEDQYKWLKYGKNGNKIYYKCKNQGCQMKKIVWTDSQKIQYKNQHNH